MGVLETYLSDVRDTKLSGEGVSELSYYPQPKIEQPMWGSEPESLAGIYEVYPGLSEFDKLLCIPGLHSLARFI